MSEWSLPPNLHVLAAPASEPNERLVALLRSILAAAERGEVVAFAGAILCADRSTGNAVSVPPAGNLIVLLGELRLAEERLVAQIHERE